MYCFFGHSAHIPTNTRCNHGNERVTHSHQTHAVTMLTSV